MEAASCSKTYTTNTAPYTTREESSTPVKTSNVAGILYLVEEWIAMHAVEVVCLCSLKSGMWRFGTYATHCLEPAAQLVVFLVKR
jgi:hypothetical protein